MTSKRVPVSKPSLRKHSRSELGDAQAADYRRTIESNHNTSTQGDPQAGKAGDSDQGDS